MKKKVFNSALNFRRVTHFLLCMFETQVSTIGRRCGICSNIWDNRTTITSGKGIQDIFSYKRLVIGRGQSPPKPTRAIYWAPTTHGQDLEDTGQKLR